MVFIKGRAEELPFPDNSFDIVLSRLAFHHFQDIKLPFQEMARVLKKDGKPVLIDMETPKEFSREARDKIESMRDLFHTKNLNRKERLNLFADHSLSIMTCEKTGIPVSLENWPELARTFLPTRTKIRNDMKSDLDGEAKTGFGPYLHENEIFFRQHWIIVINKKRTPEKRPSS